MTLEIEKTYIEDLFLVKPHIFSDFRGIYRKNYEISFFKKIGIDLSVSESSDIFSDKGVIRGLHYQTYDSQAKLVRVLRGKVFDVAVDMRPNSKTYMKTFSAILDDKNYVGMFIPKNFAHGYLSLEDKTIFSYLSFGEYRPEFCGGLRWDDPKLDIFWPFSDYNIQSPILTEKDKNWNFL